MGDVHEDAAEAIVGGTKPLQKRALVWLLQNWVQLFLPAGWVAIMESIKLIFGHFWTEHGGSVGLVAGFMFMSIIIWLTRRDDKREFDKAVSTLKMQLQAQFDELRAKSDNISSARPPRIAESTRAEIPLAVWTHNIIATVVEATLHQPKDGPIMVRVKIIYLAVRDAKLPLELSVSSEAGDDSVLCNVVLADEISTSVPAGQRTIAIYVGKITSDKRDLLCESMKAETGFFPDTDHIWVRLYLTRPLGAPSESFRAANVDFGDPTQPYLRMFAARIHDWQDVPAEWQSSAYHRNFGHATQVGNQPWLPRRKPSNSLDR